MGSSGGRVIQDIVDKIKDETTEYFLSLNELRMGARSKVPPRPDALELYEYLKDSGLRLVDSMALSDQPYIWMLIFNAVGAEKTLQEALFNQAQGNKSAQSQR